MTFFTQYLQHISMAASDYLYQFCDFYFFLAEILNLQKQKMQTMHKTIFTEISGDETSHIGECSEVFWGSVVQS